MTKVSVGDAEAIVPEDMTPDVLERTEVLKEAFIKKEGYESDDVQTRAIRFYPDEGKPSVEAEFLVRTKEYKKSWLKKLLYWICFQKWVYDTTSVGQIHDKKHMG